MGRRKHYVLFELLATGDSVDLLCCHVVFDLAPPLQLCLLQRDLQLLNLIFEVRLLLC